MMTKDLVLRIVEDPYQHIDVMDTEDGKSVVEIDVGDATLQHGKRRVVLVLTREQEARLVDQLSRPHWVSLDQSRPARMRTMTNSSKDF